MIELQPQYNIFDLGFSKLLTKESSFLNVLKQTDEGFSIPSAMESVFSGATNPSVLASGEFIGNLSVKDGYLQSANFVTGSTGWRIDANGNLEANAGTFRGTLSAASGTLGAITIGSNAWHVDINGNMWWGNYASYATAIDRISSDGIWNRVRVIKTEGGVGYYYHNESDVQNVGLDLAMGAGFSLSNSLPSIRVEMGGSGEILYGNISSTGRGILITRSVGAGTAHLLDLQSSSASAGTMVYIMRQGGGVITAIEIDHTTSSNSVNTGILMNLSSGNAALCYAARFDGSEVVSAAVGATQNKKIRISIAGTDYYIPCYTT